MPDKFYACVDLDRCDCVDFEVGEECWTATTKELLEWLKARPSLQSLQQDAEKWRRVKEIAKLADPKCPNNLCPHFNICHGRTMCVAICKASKDVVEALEGKEGA